jgi:hypothetical protein
MEIPDSFANSACSIFNMARAARSCSPVNISLPLAIKNRMVPVEPQPAAFYI